MTKRASVAASPSLDRILYVLVYPSPLFAAHWSFWLPHLNLQNKEQDTGDRIHVTGDRLNGFEYEIVRAYNVCEDERRPNGFAIGLIPAAAAAVLQSSEAEEGDANKWDAALLYKLDRACREVEAPRPSLNKVGGSSAAAGVAPKRRPVQDCQWWVKRTVEHLVDMGMLLPLHGEASNPQKVVEALPKH